MKTALVIKNKYPTIILTQEKKKTKSHKRLCADVNIDAKKGSIRFVNNNCFVVVGDEPTLIDYMTSIEKGLREALKQGVTKVSVAIDDSFLLLSEALERAVEATVLTSYVYDAYKQKTKSGITRFENIEFVVEKKTKELEQVYARSLQVAQSANMMRNLQNTPPADMYPESFAKEAKKMAKEFKLGCEVWDEKRLQKEKYNTLLAVGMGSARKPRLVTLKYSKKGAKKTICLVGKGITFDTGGYNIKPTGYMETMQYDMSGAALVFGVMQAIAQTKPDVNVIGIMALAENMVSSTAYRPSDVITTPHGITVEVGNTDAEGRLALADALHHAGKFKPDAIVDFATLTGACVITFGGSTAAIMGTDEDLVESVMESGVAVGERLWPLPLFDVYDEDIKSRVADIKNLGYKREAGTITAGAFLKQFVDDTPWAHIDIAGVADVDRPMHFTQYGGTGWGVRTIVEWLSHLE